MANEKISWTKSLDVADAYIDPSGVQEASTSLQTHLFPGMSTLTRRVRYISLLAAAKYYRIEAGLNAELPLPLSEYLHRFEALIAISSIMHHAQDSTSFDGIIGRNAARKRSQDQIIQLKTGLVRPPHTIYRRTLSDLQAFDTSDKSDPLFEDAKPLAQAWNIDTAGILAEEIKKGFLRKEIERELDGLSRLQAR